MKIPYFILSLCMLFFKLQAQHHSIEISGTISGSYNSKIYIFFEDEYKRKDSISSPVTDGRFYFKLNRQAPVLGRLFLGRFSPIADVYLEGPKMEITCTNEIRNNDSFNIFQITQVKGSRTEELKRNFESWLDKLSKSGLDEKAVNEQYYQQLMTVVQNNPGSKVSPYLISKAYSLPVEKLETLYKLLAPALANSYETAQTEKLIARHKNYQEHIVIGNAFKNVALIDRDSNTVNTDRYKGKYLYIVLWGSHCAPCIREQPDIKAFYTKYGNNNLEILGISTDRDFSKWINTMSNKDLPWPQALDKKDAIISYYGIEAIPCHILLDREGKIFKWDLKLAELEELVAGNHLK
ncbi:TlpA disulfide reductase family protein [Niastella populi]|nr:TlpA disulfide reductase family protein [Niastella populi]